MKVGVFDSGIGGLTVLRSLIDRFPNNEYIYYGDTLNVPYGNKSIETLKLLSSNIMDFLIKKNVDIIIIACGTISSNLKDYLINKYDIDIIDIVSPTINYLNNSNYNKIGLLATSNTIKSRIFSKNIKKDIKEVECPLFVNMIENNNYADLKKYIEIYLSDLKDRDLIVLGCTHYPIIKKQIHEYIPNIELLDMGDIISLTNNGKYKLEMYFSKINETILNNINNIIGKYEYIIEEYNDKN